MLCKFFKFYGALVAIATLSYCSLGLADQEQVGTLDEVVVTGSRGFGFTNGNGGGGEEQLTQPLQARRFLFQTS